MTRKGVERGHRGEGAIRTANPLAASLAGFLLLAGVTARAEPGAIGIELNKLQDVDGGCRISLVFNNGLAHAVEALSIETVLFGKDGAVQEFLVLKSNPLPAAKVRVQQFDIAGAKCGAIGRVLLNDVKECKVADLTPAACLAAIAPSSRTDTEFFSDMTAGPARDKQP